MKQDIDFSTHVPMNFRRRGGKSVMVMPDGSRAVQRREVTIDNSMIKVIARGFRWQRMLEDGDYTTLGDLAKAENLNPTYISRLVRLALLAPDIVEAIMVGLQPAHLTMKDLMGPFPAEWAKQRAWFYQGSGAL